MKERNRAALLVAIVVALTTTPITASAHVDPPGCSDNDTAILLSVLHADGTTAVTGSVSECETINYRAILAKGQQDDFVCAFSGGTFELTTPDGVVHVIDANVPCIGGTSGEEGCDSALDFIESPLIPYTMDLSNVVGGIISASAAYTGGTLHDSPGDTGVTGANASQDTPVAFCNDTSLCTVDTCDPSGAGAAACVNAAINCDDGDACTSGDTCDPATAQCIHGIVNCNDHDACTVDVCDPASGCVNTPLDCNDGNPCTSDGCSLGQCFHNADSTDVCRPAEGVCDAVESCTGSSPLCPPDGLRSSAFTCRPSTGACDPAETCTGSSVECPVNALADDDTPCDDSDACTTLDHCASGICTGQPDPSCATTTTTTLPVPLCGDANDDGDITASDALWVINAAVGAAGCLIEVCDYNGTGKVTAGDALAILRVAVGDLVLPLCPQPVPTPPASLSPTTLAVTTTTL